MIGKIFPFCSASDAWCTVDSGVTDTMALAYTGLVENGAQVINHSGFIQYHSTDPLVLDDETEMYDCSTDPGMICTALEFANERDITIFAASGNNKWNAINFPARDDRVIAVGGIDSNLNFWDIGLAGSSNRGIFSGSNFGNEQALVAPAGASPAFINPPYGGVLSTFYTGWPWVPTLYAYNKDYRYACTDHHPGQNEPDTGNQGYDICTGTSMSSPYAAAIGAIVRGINPLLNKDSVRDILTSTAHTLSTPPDIWDDHYGYGIPDAAKAVTAARGKVAGRVPDVLQNRLTPLFGLHSNMANDHLYTTVPQMATAAIWDIVATDYQSDANSPLVPGYDPFPGACLFGLCPTFSPMANAYVFTAEYPPYVGGLLSYRSIG